MKIIGGGLLAAAALRHLRARPSRRAVGAHHPQRVADDAMRKRPVLEPATPGVTYLYSREAALMRCSFGGFAADACGKRWRAFCPEFALRRGAPPFWIVQGAVDTVVPPKTAEAFAYHVRAVGSRATVTLVPGYSHDDREVYASPARKQAMLQWVASVSR